MLMDLLREIKISAESSEEENWTSIADIMAGLMMVFLFIAIIYIQFTTNQIEGHAKGYADFKDDLYDDLQDKFKNKLKHWNASIDRDTLSIKFIPFEEPRVFFDEASSEISEEYKKILKAFFPDYADVLYVKKFREFVEEIRIEGYTSTGWKGMAEDQAYFENMKLSQARTRAVLQHSLGLIDDSVKRNWLKDRLTANGLSSSKPILNKNGTENSFASRRVEFRVRGSAEKRLEGILKK